MAQPKKTPLWIVALPALFFAGLALMFYIQLQKGGNDGQLPSALVGKPIPLTQALPLAGTTIRGFASDDFQNKITLVNIWASWCGPCRAEHPLLMRVAQDETIQLFGINYKDAPDQAVAFLVELGNPYAAINTDRKGNAAIEWGVFGVPETYVVGPDGMIAYRYAGPLTDQLYQDLIQPEIDKARLKLATQ